MTSLGDMRIVIATSIFARARGLLGTRAEWGDGNRMLILVPCKSVHTIGMRYALDIAFVDRNGIVLRSERNVRPGRVLSCRQAAFVLERPHQDEAWAKAEQRLLVSFCRDFINDQATQYG